MSFSLVDACELGDIRRVQELIQSGDDPNQIRGMQTPLMIATYGGHIDIVEMLIASKADVCSLDDKSRSTLFYVSSQSDDLSHRFVQCIVDAGAFSIIDHPDDQGKSALIHHIEMFQESVALALLQAGASPLGADRWGTTPLLAACSASAQPRTVAALFDARATTSIDVMCPAGETALRRAVHAACPTTVRLLLAAGASIHRARDQWPLLHEACRFHDRTEVAAELLAAGASVHARHGGTVPLLCACECERDGRGPGGPAAMVTMLLAARADPFVTDDNGRTALMAAARQTGVSLVPLLEHVRRGLGGG